MAGFRKYVTCDNDELKLQLAPEEESLPLQTFFMSFQVTLTATKGEKQTPAQFPFLQSTMMPGLQGTFM